MIRTSSCLIVAIALIGSPLVSRGDLVYSDNFNSGSSKGTASDYYSDSTQNNGLVVSSENYYSGSSTGIGHDVTATGMTGSGDFLFNGTLNEDAPSDKTSFYISSSFTVTPGTTYAVSFFLTNDNTTNVAAVFAEMNGTALGDAVSASGDYATDGWQKFSFTYTDTSDTSATLRLVNTTLTSHGNDFGVDVIQVASIVPEPSSLVMCGIAGALGLAVARVRRKRAERRRGTP